MEIIKKDNPILRQISEPVDIEVDLERNLQLIKDMVETVKASGGVGLAAPQVGILKRIIVVKDSDTSEFTPMINPEITWTSFDKECKEEGCLSVLDENNKPIHKKIFRYTRIKVKYFGLMGHQYERLIKNHLMARIIQHEVDHLNGKLFIDYLENS